MCAWINDCLEERFHRQDELVEYLAVNLEIAVRRLRATADAFEGRRRPEQSKVTAVSYWPRRGNPRRRWISKPNQVLPTRFDVSW